MGLVASHRPHTQITCTETDEQDRETDRHTHRQTHTDRHTHRQTHTDTHTHTDIQKH